MGEAGDSETGGQRVCGKSFGESFFFFEVKNPFSTLSWYP